MALIKEDGSVVTGANTYALDADLTAYATARGITVPATEGAREILLVKAMDWLEAQDLRYQGLKVGGFAQVLTWPRSGVYFGGSLYGDDAIPPELVKLQLILAVAAQTVDLFPVVAGSTKGMLTRTTVGPITLEYAASSVEKSLRPIISQASAYTDFLFGFTGQLRNIRA